MDNKETPPTWRARVKKFWSDHGEFVLLIVALALSIRAFIKTLS